MDKCRVVYMFFSIFNFRCHKPNEIEQERLSQASSNFMRWLRKFVKKNRIFFPHLDTLFLRLIYCMVPSYPMISSGCSGSNVPEPEVLPHNRSWQPFATLLLDVVHNPSHGSHGSHGASDDLTPSQELMSDTSINPEHSAIETEISIEEKRDLAFIECIMANRDQPASASASSLL